MGRTGKELFTGPNTPMCHSFLFYIGNWKFLFHYFFCQGWYGISIATPDFSFFITFTPLIISYGFTLSLSKHGFQNYFLQMAVVWYVISNYHSLFSTNKSKWLFNCWHFYATCRSLTDLGNRTHFCISKLRKVRQKEVTWQANDIFLR